MLESSSFSSNIGDFSNRLRRSEPSEIRLFFARCVYVEIDILTIDKEFNSFFIFFCHCVPEGQSLTDIVPNWALLMASWARLWIMLWNLVRLTWKKKIKEIEIEIAPFPTPLVVWLFHQIFDMPHFSLTFFPRMWELPEPYCRRQENNLHYLPRVLWQQHYWRLVSFWGSCGN